MEIKMKMNNRINFLAVLLVIFVLSGCVTVPIPSPTPERNSLLAGKFTIELNTTGAARDANASFDYGIRVFIENNETKSETAFTTHIDGWLITNTLAAGDYSITKLEITTRVGNTTWTFTLPGPFNVTIAEGMVNNIGSIELDVQGNQFTWRVISYDAIRNEFATISPDSEWNSYEWRNDNAFLGRQQ